MSPPPDRPELEINGCPHVDGVELVRIDRSTTRWAAYQKSWDICLIADGRATWRYRGREHDSPAGIVRLKEPGERFETTEVPAPASLHIIKLRPAFFARLAADVPASRCHLSAAQITVDPRPLARTFAALWSGRLTALEAESALIGASRLLLGRLEVAPRSQTPSRRAMERVREHLMAHLDEEVPLARLADLAGVHRVSLVRAFRRCFGLPPHAWQIEMRIERARERLRRGADHADLAIDLGFYDQSHFIRHFKRIVGVTPGTYATT